MTREELAARIEEIRIKLFRTAMIYLGNEHDAIEAVDEAVYRGLCAVKKLRQPEYFDTWMTRCCVSLEDLPWRKLPSSLKYPRERQLQGKEKPSDC